MIQLNISSKNQAPKSSANHLLLPLSFSLLIQKILSPLALILSPLALILSSCECGETSTEPKNNIPPVTWQETTFSEDSDNTGSFPNPIEGTIAEGTFLTGTSFENGVHYSVQNLPSGLTLSLTSTDEQTVELSITTAGDFSDHAIADNGDFTLTLSNKAFVNVPTSFSEYSFRLRFGDLIKPSLSDLTLSPPVLRELESNNGDFPTMEITLADGDPWTFHLVDAMNADNHEFIFPVTGSGFPTASGDYTLERTSEKQLLVRFTRQTEHAQRRIETFFRLRTNAVDNVFTYDAAAIGPTTEWYQWDVTFQFIDTFPEVTWAAMTFSEDSDNTGSFSNPIKGTITEGAFLTGTSFENGVHYSVQNLPSGLTLSLTSTDDQTVELSITTAGDFSDHAIADNGDFTLTLLNEAFVNVNIPTDFSEYNFQLRFGDLIRPSLSDLTLSPPVIRELESNNGDFPTMEITLAPGDPWTFHRVEAINTDNNEFIFRGAGSGFPTASGDYTLERTSEKQLLVRFTQQTDHAQRRIETFFRLRTNAVDNVFTYDAAAMGPTTEWYQWDVTFQFIDAFPEVTWATMTFSEDSDNTGSFPNPIEGTITDGTFLTGTSFENGVHYSVQNLPSGLTLSLTSTDEKTVELSITTAVDFSDHAIADNGDFTLTLSNKAFVNVLTSFSEYDFQLRFGDLIKPPLSDLTLSPPVLRELESNNGDFPTMEITLAPGDPWTFLVDAMNANNHEFIFQGAGRGFPTASGDYTLERTSEKQLLVRFTQQTDHAQRRIETFFRLRNNAVDNVFTYDAAAMGPTPEWYQWDVAFQFIDAFSEVTWAAMTFSEDSDNTGSFSNPIEGTIVEGTFLTGTSFENGVHYSVQNLPSGLTLSLTSTGEKTVELSITTAVGFSDHTIADNRDFTLTLSNEAFVNVPTSSFSEYNFQLRFGDLIKPPLSDLTLSPPVLRELEPNNGDFPTMEITLAPGDPWTFHRVEAINTDNNEFIFRNTGTGFPIASGDYTLERTSEKQLLVRFTRQTDHAERQIETFFRLRTNAVDNVLTYDAAAMGPTTEWYQWDVTFEFIHIPEVTWATMTFSEDSDNTGSFPNPIEGTITDGTFLTGSTSFENGVHYSVQNLPSGLTLSLTSIDDQTVELSITTAVGFSDHAVADSGAFTLTLSNEAFVNVPTSFSEYSFQLRFGDLIKPALSDLILSPPVLRELESNDGDFPTMEITLASGDPWTFHVVEAINPDNHEFIFRGAGSGFPTASGDYTLERTSEKQLLVRFTQQTEHAQRGIETFFRLRNNAIDNVLFTYEAVAMGPTPEWYQWDVTFLFGDPNPIWSPRSGHTSVVFDNKIWIMGGEQDAGGRINDVWSSPDGMTWTESPATGHWSSRRRHTSVVFDSKIWIMGGEDRVSAQLNDVWSSPDGTDWTVSLDTSPWSKRTGHTSVVFDNKIWIMGGVAINTMNDIWSSPDGMTWTESPATGHWSSRHRHTSVTFNNKIWILGGNSIGLLNDVWSSSDGMTWTESSATGHWSTRRSPTSVVFDNKIWIHGGGQFTRASIMNDIWSSPDGTNWTIAFARGGRWSGRQSHVSVIFDNKIWIMGGFDRNGNTRNDVWSSPDGTIWTASPTLVYP